MQNPFEKVPTLDMEIRNTYMWAKGFVPQFLVKRWKGLISYGDLEVNPDVFSGFLLVNSVLLGLSAMTISAALKIGFAYSIVLPCAAPH